MPLRIVDELKDAASSTLQQASLISVVALALLVAAGFLCAAAFVVVLQSYGPAAACLVLAGIFLVIAAIAGVIYAVRKRQIEARAPSAREGRASACRSRCRGNGPADRPSHRCQAADSPARPRRRGAWIPRDPRHGARRDAGGVD